MMIESVLLGLFCVFLVYGYICQYKAQEAEKKAKRAAERQQQLILERRQTEEAWINLFNLLNDEFIHSFKSVSCLLQPDSVEISAEKKGEAETNFVQDKLNFILSNAACREKISAILQDCMEKRKTEQEKIFRQYKMAEIECQQKNLKNPAMDLDFLEFQKFETEMQGRLNDFYARNQKLISETLKIQKCQEIWSRINLVKVKNVVYQPITKTYLIQVTLRDDK